MNELCEARIRFLELNIAKLEKISPIVDEVGEVVKEIKMIFDGKLPVSFYLSQDLIINLSIHPNNLDEIANILRLLARRGFHQKNEKRESIDNKMIVWETVKDDVQLDVNAFFNRYDAACRYVEVGKKEVPVYELKCN